MALSSLNADVASARLRRASLRQIDELVQRAGTPSSSGLAAVQASPEVLEALVRHIDRRARGAGRATVIVGGLPSDDPWRELCCQVLPPGLRVASLDAIEAATALIAHAGDAILVIRDDAPTRFGHALLRELQRELSASLSASSPRATVLFLGTSAASSAPLGWAYSLTPELSPDEVEVWWEGVARGGAPRPIGNTAPRLDTLEAWWSSASHARLQLDIAPRASRPMAPVLTRAASALHRRIVLSQRSWAVGHIGRLGTTGTVASAMTAAAEELVRANVLAIDARGVLVAGDATQPDTEPTDEDIATVAEALDELADPWAWARASELHARRISVDAETEARAAASAEQSARRAIASTADPEARADLWERWARALGRFSPRLAERCLLSGVDLALRSGDVEQALLFATGRARPRERRSSTRPCIFRVPRIPRIPPHCSRSVA